MPEDRSKRPAGATAVLCARQPFRAAEPAAADGGELARRVRASRTPILWRALPVEPRCQNGSAADWSCALSTQCNSDLAGSERLSGGLGVG